MKKAASVLITGVLAATVLAGCGGDSPYCAAVKDKQSSLESFGEKRTNAGFSAYTKVARAIASEAPGGVKKDWTALADATAGVLKAHRSVGIRLEQMSNTAKVAELSTAQLKTINDSYNAFNRATKTQGKAVVDNVVKECKITLA